jgi:hypothetical protein
MFHLVSPTVPPGPTQALGGHGQMYNAACNDAAPKRTCTGGNGGAEHRSVTSNAVSFRCLLRHPRLRRCQRHQRRCQRHQRRCQRYPQCPLQRHPRRKFRSLSLVLEWAPCARCHYHRLSQCHRPSSNLSILGDSQSTGAQDCLH